MAIREMFSVGGGMYIWIASYISLCSPICSPLIIFHIISEL